MSAREVLARIEAGDPDVIQAVWDSFPSPYEVDMADEAAIKCLLAAIVAAGRTPRESGKAPKP